jgi:2-aminoadipate transaminase
MGTLWNHRYAQRTQRMTSSVIRELLKLTALPDVISFAGGLPGPDLFPVEEMKEAVEIVLETRGRIALQYSTTEGYPPLREMIARHMARYGVVVDIDNILITGGSQQALDLIGKVLVNPGDRLLVESPTYLGAIQAFTMYGAEYATVPTDDDGMVTDRLEEALRCGPKFIYALPNFQNPSGVTMPLDRRQALIRASEHYGIPIIEDDPYGQLRYEGEHITPLVVLDAMRQDTGDKAKYSGNVIYLSTFSKTLAPGLRMAWVAAPKEVIDKLVQAKQGTDLQCSTFDQMVTYEVGNGGFIDRHVQKIREVYGRRRNVMLAALEKAFPDPSLGVRWTRPQGGLFLWVTVPEWIDTADLLEEAVKEKVAFVPGAAFFPCGGGQNTMRLNFSHANEAHIEEGIARLGRAVVRQIETRDATASRQPPFDKLRAAPSDGEGPPVASLVQ